MEIQRCRSEIDSNESPVRLTLSLYNRIRKLQEKANADSLLTQVYLLGVNSEAVVWTLEHVRADPDSSCHNFPFIHIDDLTETTIKLYRRGAIPGGLMRMCGDNCGGFWGGCNYVMKYDQYPIIVMIDRVGWSFYKPVIVAHKYGNYDDKSVSHYKGVRVEMSIVNSRKEVSVGRQYSEA